MDNIKGEPQGDKIIVSEVGYPSHAFWCVDFFPTGHVIWNIGKHHMPSGYLPICLMAPGGEGQIQVESLKAIKTDGADVILDAVGCGPNTLKEMELFVKKHGNSSPGSRYYENVQRIKKALPYLREIRHI